MVEDEPMSEKLDTGSEHIPEKKPVNAKPIRALGFDFGLRWIGVATGQMITRSAQPLTTLDAQQGIPQWDQIQTLIDEWRPTDLVVGIPVHMNGSEQEITLAAKRFANRLHGRFGLPVHGVDERLSTKEARASLFEVKGSRGLKKQAIDSYSAKLILESWLVLQPEV